MTRLQKIRMARGTNQYKSKPRKRAIFLAFMLIALTWLYLVTTVVNTVMPIAHANAPEGNFTHPIIKVVKNPVSEHDQIIAYIKEVFGQDADKAFTLLSCENHALNPEAMNDNTAWGGRGRDWGIFQVNDSWQGVSGRFLKNWRVNIQVAYQIYIESGRNFHLWTCGRNLGI